ncbi:hypothetical protein AB7315_21610 [Providencia manganoxydans]|uniref:hypothetical protein n=1 Tax=Providencia manganoxydans TaxID=2923283 RepID=UPI0034E5D830
MSDKKEIATLSIKISVDSTDLDKLETQLKRINGLMISTGLKQTTSVGFSADEFFIANGQVFVNAPCIVSGTIRSAKINDPAIANAMLQAVKEGAKKGAEQASAEVKLNDTERKIEETDATEVLDKISETLHSSGNKAVIAALNKTIDINTPVSREELKKHKQYVEASLDEMQSQLIGFHHALVASEQSTAQHLSGLQRQITELGKEIEEVKLKSSLNAINIISIKQTMEQQEKSLAGTIKRTIAEDLCRGGTLSRMF